MSSVGPCVLHTYADGDVAHGSRDPRVRACPRLASRVSRPRVLGEWNVSEPGHMLHISARGLQCILGALWAPLFAKTGRRRALNRAAVCAPWSVLCNRVCAIYCQNPVGIFKNIQRTLHRPRLFGYCMALAVQERVRWQRRLRRRTTAHAWTSPSNTQQHHCRLHAIS